MKNSTYKTLRNLIATLQEATGMLCNCTNTLEKQQLLAGVDEFISTVLGFAETAGEECIPLADAVKELSQWLHEESPDFSQYLTLAERTETSLCGIYDVNFSIEQLKEETNFIRYIELLQWAAERYCILIASSDTPCGSPLFTHNVGQELCKVGIKTNLSDKFRASYAAIIDSGKTIAERISLTESIRLEESLGDVHITIKSSGMNVKDSSNGVYIDIQKDNERVLNQATDMPAFVRGLLFAVYDKEENVVCDIAGFDTYIPYLTCVRKENKLIKMIEDAYPGVTFIKYAAPKFTTDTYSENELYILNRNIDYSLILAYPEIKSAIRDSIKETDGIREVLTPPNSYINVNGARCFEDHTGTYLNTINGHRKTTGQPAKPKRTIYMLGGCGTAGIGVRDEGTYASQLQMLLNEHAKEHGFLVENYGFPLDGMDYLKEEVAILGSLPLKSGDIVIGLGNNTYDMERNYEKDRRKYGEIFFDKKHLTEAGNRLVADGIFLALRENNFFEETLDIEQPERKNDNYKRSFTEEQMQELASYKQMLSDLWTDNMQSSEDVGAIVMNCNPFTLGHRYLIEQAAKQCEQLLIFVVQEDKSFFPYNDRIELVRQGVQDLSNVSVVGSGKFIISSLTFQSYFNKAALQDRTIDCSDDVTLFVNEIAPAANIKTRFVGEEPLDQVTNQYNRTLEKILPMNGIRFVEIPRITTGDNVISASRVRQLLQEKNWDEIKRYVPETTLRYLEEKFG